MKWTEEPVFNKAGKRLVFDVEPCQSCDFDVLTVETLESAVHELEMLVGDFEDEPGVELQVTITPRWVTAAEWEAEQREWVNGD